MPRVVSGLLSTLGLLAVVACQGGVDWEGPENLLLRETAAEKDGRAELEYWSLLDAPCQPVFDALADVEHYPDFVPGVDRVQVLAQAPNSKTVQIAQRVIGRQNSAKVEWNFYPERWRIDFRTLASDLTYNDGGYVLEQSPNGKRCLVRTTYLVKEGKGLSLGALRQASQEAFVAAARGVRKRVGDKPTG